MRARNIKPGFLKNEVIVELAFEYRILFAGLWMLADCEGRLEDRPKRIKMEVFPADDVDVEYVLQCLEEKGLVERYKAEGIAVVLITKFKKNQSPHHSEKRSELPGPDGKYTDKRQKKAASGSVETANHDGGSTADETKNHATGNEGSPGTNGNSTESKPENYGRPTVGSRNRNGRSRPDSHDSLIPDSHDSLIPDSVLNTIGPSSSDDPTQHDQPEPARTDQQPINESVDPPAEEKPARTARTEYPPEFDLIWQKYPDRPGSNPRRKAFHAWNARLKEGHDSAEILAGVVRYAKFCDQTGKTNTEYVMQAQRFLGKSCEFENPWKPPERLPPDRNQRGSRHSGFGDIDYSQGIKQGVPDGVANF